MALWNKATELEVPECSTCKGEKFIRTNGKLKACPMCNQALPSTNHTPYNPFGHSSSSFDSGFNRTLSDDELST